MTDKNNMKNIELAETEKVNGAGYIYGINDLDEMSSKKCFLDTLVADTKPRFYGVGC